MGTLALSYARRSWAILPLAGKLPAIPKSEGGRGYLGATTDEDTIRRLWTKYPIANIGIATKASGLLVVDVDPQHGGDKTLARLEATHGPLPKSAMGMTGSGGCHIYLRAPAGDGIQRRANALGQGLDLPNYVVAPGSIHPTTNKKYILAEDSSFDTIPPAPQWLLDLASSDRRQGSSARRASQAGKGWRKEVLEGAPEGTRNEYLFRETSRLRKLGLSREEVEKFILLLNKDNDSPLPDAEVLALIDSAWRYEKESTGTPPTIVSAKELARMTFAELRWAIARLVPEGLALLAGRPKAGKSFLALQMALSVATGRNWLEESSCEQGDVLFLALEDGGRRMKQRLSDMIWALSTYSTSPNGRGGWIIHRRGPFVPPNLHFATDWPRMDEGCVERLETFLDEHPNTRLVVIDVLQRVVVREKGKTMYEADYEALRPLHGLARDRGIAILVVHHSRKAKAEDIFETVSGSNGLTGAADTILVLEKQRGRRSILHVTGRDIDEERELGMEHRYGGRWLILGDADAKEKGDGRPLSGQNQVVFDLLKREGAMGPSAIAKALGWKLSTTNSHLRRMRKQGIVENTNGKWSIAEPEGESMPESETPESAQPVSPV
jgi:hypothetical protein